MLHKIFLIISFLITLALAKDVFADFFLNRFDSPVNNSKFKEENLPELQEKLIFKKQRLIQNFIDSSESETSQVAYQLTELPKETQEIIEINQDLNDLQIVMENRWNKHLPNRYSRRNLIWGIAFLLVNLLCFNLLMSFFNWTERIITGNKKSYHLL